MYNTENPYKSAGEYLKAPLFEKYQLRRAAVKTSTALFPFMLFAAIFAFIILILGKVFPPCSTDSIGSRICPSSFSA